MTNDHQEFFPTQPTILGFDPGRDKCGIAVMGLDRQLYNHQVLPAKQVITTINNLQEKFPISLIVMGDQTTAKGWQKLLQVDLLKPVNIIMVDERYTSLEARDRYWQMYPPQGLIKILPPGIRTPSQPIDDIVAILLIERYLNRLTS
ncbi:Resolvase, RNase H-like fold [Richelia intracellularis HH01]|uniref:Resolvase, RNase H-like fold n=1 Tax=Richelia intracellularis HH01 TaxID=1165094 RepID=M1X087_9NOST|nr:pre-16S rRNA-processing nuclease YqgF [Richelia intracellularis]CCH67368.1 Resolvase, RNase H-like fold [Richelia intracellularis HH01]HAE06505.1 Holliday junction resolvase RuvX [Richelia sp.]